jgi:hypothetical protein
MKVFEAHIDKWYVQCLPEDGGRISILQYGGINLLTAIPGSCSNLEKSWNDGICLEAEAGKSLSWVINWELSIR